MDGGKEEKEPQKSALNKKGIEKIREADQTE